MFFPLPVQITEPHIARVQRPVANWMIIAANVLAFLLFDTFRWAAYRGASPASILGYGFAHAGFWHLVLNMWVLWLFGNPINRRIGNGYYALAYLATIVALGFFAYLFVPVPVVGASGAIYAVIGIAVLLLPSARMTVVYAAVFPLTILLGLIERPKYGIYWFLRGGEFRVSVLWCLLLVPFLEFAGMFFWWLSTGGWHWGHFAHVLGFFCGIGVVLLLPRTLTLGRRAAAWGS